MNAQPDIRLLVADVDGSLVTSDKVLTEAAKAASLSLLRAAARHAACACSSSRSR
jgi:hypothetical protein